MHAAQHGAEHLVTPLFRGDPGAILPRRIVAHVLSVSAFEVRYPVAFVVEVKADDAPWNAARWLTQGTGAGYTSGVYRSRYTERLRAGPKP